jgi:hypothetical protein
MAKSWICTKFSHDPAQGRLIDGVTTAVSEPKLDNTEPSRLASIVDLDPSAERLWKPQELAALLRHQLAVPVPLEQWERAQAPSDKPTGSAIRSFGDLLNHPIPPIELLVMLKDFAKANAGHPDSALPSEVAKVLYYLAISVALLRHNHRITSMSDADLGSSLRWAIGLPWIGPQQQSLLKQAMARLP